MSDVECGLLHRAFPSLNITATACCSTLIECANGTITAVKLPARNLSGPLPPTLGDLTGLTALYLYNNHFTGPIPDEYSKLSNMEDLELHHNSLSGNLTASLGNLTKLKTLTLWENQLSGQIPDEWSQLTNLEDVELNGNSLSGRPPAWFALFTKLKSLYLYNNQFTGQIPDEWGKLSNIQDLELEGNRLSGKLPDWIATTKIANLRFYGNCFTNADFTTTQVSDTNKPQKNETECLGVRTSSTQPTLSTDITSSGNSESSASRPIPVGLIAGIGLPLVLLIVTLSIVAVVLFKRRKAPADRKEKQSLELQPTTREADFLVVSEPSSNDNTPAYTNATEQTLARASSIMKGRGLFSAAENPHVSEATGSDTEDQTKVPEDSKSDVGKNTKLSSHNVTISSAQVSSSDDKLAVSSPTESQQAGTSSTSSDVQVIFEKKRMDSGGDAGARGLRRTDTGRQPILSQQNLAAWNADEVGQWLYNDVGVRSDVVELLKGLNVDGTKLLTVTDTDLIEMGVSQGYARLSILTAVGDVSHGVNSSGPSSEVPPPYMGS
ncbi:hypothetical protein HDU97_003992 [Phlyctochytrium planicorne]|nr:hypothetical protein HDU97_003992 [Phlyctochytrium planicorne]